MNIDLLCAELYRDEGFRGDVYKDTGGHRTILIGHNLDASPLCEAAGKAQLRHDLSLTIQFLDAECPWWRRLSDARMRALANMAFQMGSNGLLEFKKMLAAMQAGDWKESARQALDSKWAGQVGERAQRIAKMIEEG